MPFFAHLRALTVLGIVAAAPLAFASSIDYVILGSNGTVTNFNVVGTYPAGTPVTPFSSPNSVYSLMFQLPTTPDPATFDFTLPFGAFAITTDVSVNGTDFNHSEVIFFDASLGGGMNICLNSGCVDTNPVCDFSGCVDSNPPAPNSWAIYGDQVYTGDQYNPTFISNNTGINFSHADSYISIAATPEPSSLALLGTGMLGAVTTGFRRLRSRRSRS